jgi:hypothetical protein
MKITSTYRIILGLILSFSFTSSIAQTKHRIYLTDRVEDDKIKKSHAIVPVYKYVSTSIESFDMFGVNKKPEDRERIEIKKLPNMSRSRDTGYTYIYFSGANSTINQGYILTLIGNYRRSRRTVYFHIDRNNNFDFTDDGPPDSLIFGSMNFEVVLKNTQNENAEHHIRLSRIRYGKNLAYKSLLTDHFKVNSGSKIFTNINYCYREQRLNTLSGVLVNASDSFRVGIKDMNVNGLFNESCIDRFYIGPKNEAIFTDEMLEIQPTYEKTLFEWNKKQYHIVNIDPQGQYVDIEQVEFPKLQKQLKIGRKISNFPFVNTKNQREELKEFKKGEVFLYFWDRETLDSTDELYLKKIKQEYSERIQVIALNHGDHPRQVRVYEYYNDVEWKIGYSSGFIGRQFYLEAVPTGFYLGKRCKLKGQDLSPIQMYTLLQSEKK